MTRFCHDWRPIISSILLSGCAPIAMSADHGRQLKIAAIEQTDGQPRAAAQSAAAVPQASPKDAGAWVIAADAQYAIGQLNEARGSYQRALQIDPSAEEARVGLAKLQIATDPVSAAKALQDLLEVHPLEERLWTDLGVAYDASLRPVDAQAAYRHALTLNPVAVAPQIDLGLSLALSGKAREGATLLSEVASTANAPRSARQDLALALALDGRAGASETLLAVDLPVSQATEERERFSSLHNALP